MQNHESAIETPAQNTTPIVTYVLLAVVILQGFFNIYLLTGNSVTLPASTGIDALGVKKALLELEYEKVGGKENYDLVSKATLIQMQEQIPQIKQFIESQGGATPTAPVAENINQTMDAAQVDKIISGAALEGNTQADIVVIEYSDMECPFCIRQYAETKLRESLVKQYGDKVAFAYKNNRGVNHSGTEAKAIGALCAKKVGGNEAYAKFYHTVMDGTTQSAVYPVANLGQAAKTAGVDAIKWQTCYDAKETAAEFLAETQEANGLGLGGTPGTLILNVKTGKYATVEGAYPLANFVQKIDALMN
jgi:protein-disulfide isomerase